MQRMENEFLEMLRKVESDKVARSHNQAHYLREFAAMEPRTVIDPPKEQEQCN
jgi:hypothetical protein